VNRGEEARMGSPFGNIGDVLAMTVAQAVELFQKRKEIVRKLQAMHGVGLAYLTLGQSR
jgi:excinuclease ABC subunit A